MVTHTAKVNDLIGAHNADPAAYERARRKLNLPKPAGEIVASGRGQEFLAAFKEERAPKVEPAPAISVVPEIEPSMLDKALEWAKQGYNVFPCAVGKKTPACPNGLYDATTDPERIRELWHDPNFNIGCAPDKSGCFVLDVDRKNSKDGFSSLAELETEHGKLPVTMAVNTPSGGRHLWFRGKAPSSVSKKTLGTGLDIRGVGGYVLLPPSVVDGSEYRLVVDGSELPHEIAEAPEWLLKAALPEDKGDGPKPASTDPPVSVSRLKRLLRSLDPGVGRNDWRDVIAAIRATPLIGEEKDEETQRVVARKWSAGEYWHGGAPDNWGGDEAVDAVFDSMPPMPGGVGFGTIVEKAREAGMSRADTHERPTDLYGNSPAIAQLVQLPAVAPSGEVVKNLPANLAAYITERFTPSKRTPAEIFTRILQGYSPEVGEIGTLPDDLRELPPFPDRNKAGPRPTTANARVILDLFGLDCRYDVFHNKMLISGHAITFYHGELGDHAISHLRRISHEWFKFDPGEKAMRDGVIQRCLQNRFDPILDYLDGLQWDGTKRLDQWLTRYMNAANTPLNRAIGRLSLVAAVRRAREPGVKFDQIIVLESAEGKGKSTAIEIMAGTENFSDQTILGLSDRDQQEHMEGVWLYEIADLTGIAKADVDKVKAFASRTEDRARPAYGYFRKDQKRRGVIFATTNDSEYLKSQTGNRRFWPVPVGKIDLDGLRRDRDQLWAEAAHVEATGLSLFLPESLWDAAGEAQEARRERHPWEDILADLSGVVCPAKEGGQEERVLSTDLLTHKIKLPVERQTPQHLKNLKQVMNRLGWEGPEVMRVPEPKEGNRGEGFPGGLSRGYRRATF
jgi:hypothetical protein